MSRIASLSPNYIVLYIVDPVNNNYTQYNPSSDFESLGLAKQGNDFFKDVQLDAPKAFAQEDLERHLSIMRKENIMGEIAKNGFFAELIERQRLDTTQKNDQAEPAPEA